MVRRLTAWLGFAMLLGSLAMTRSAGVAPASRRRGDVDADLPCELRPGAGPST